MSAPKIVIIQPSHFDCRKLEKDSGWSNDSFNNLSRLFDAQLFHITNDNIDETADIYWLIQFDINLIEKEIAFLKKMKEKGKKILVGFSQDRRFLMGIYLVNDRGTSYSELCDIADGIGGGINPNYNLFGRNQHKVIPFGEVLEDFNFSIPYENRDINLMVSGEKNGETLPFEIEFMLMVHQRYPERKLAICIPNHIQCKEALIQKYPQIMFPTDKVPFIDHLKRSKYYCNMELRPRGGRCLIESYYCRVPFISSWGCYHSNLMNEYTYKTYDFGNMLANYELLTTEVSHSEQIKKMEERAKYDEFPAVYDRIVKRLW